MSPIDPLRRGRCISALLGTCALASMFSLVGGTVGAGASIDPDRAGPLGITGEGAASVWSMAGHIGARQTVPQDEQRFVDLINELRIGLGLEPLTVHPTLALLARDWAGHLRSQGALSHATDLSVGVSDDWTRLGENVGVGPPGQVQELFDAFVASPTHYDNLVKADYRYIGIGVVYGDEGRIWTAHRFMAVNSPQESAGPVSTTSPTTSEPATLPPSTRPSTTIPSPTTPSSTTRPPTTEPPATIDTPQLEPKVPAVSPRLVERLAADLAAAGL